jgi:hypothetical protein
MKKLLPIILLLSFNITTLFAITAEEIAKKSYRVNHTLDVKNLLIKKQKRQMILSVSRSIGVKPRITALERFLSNDFKDSHIESKDLIIIRSGKLNGLGVLMTSYNDPLRSHEYLMWIPALRKVRRMAEPKEAGMGAGDIAFLEDAKLRRYHEESYHLIESKKMNLDLKMMAFKKGEFGRYEKYIPYKKHTKLSNKKIYIIKSTYKKKGHWYAYRISYIDSQNFRDYMTFYYKDNKKIKEVYRHWTSIGKHSSYWYYWYSKDLQTGHEMFTFIPKKLIKINQSMKKSFWSTATLEKIKR